MAHRHSFRYSSCKGKNVTFRCSCGEFRERKAKREEAQWLKESLKKSSLVHKVWHDFVQRFGDSPKSWKCEGADFQDRVEKWAEKYPNDVRITTCDDSYFSTSLLVLIEHRTANAYMGTTVVVIPQCSGDPPSQFFLYPGHALALIEALKDVRAKAVPVEKADAKRSREPRRWRL